MNIENKLKYVHPINALFDPIPSDIIKPKYMYKTN